MLQAKKDRAKDRRKKGLPKEKVYDTLISIHKRRIKERLKEAEEKAVATHAKETLKRKKANKKQSETQAQEVATYLAISRWETATKQEKSGITTCSTCGYPGHRTKRSIYKCPFTRDYQGKLPRRKHRRSEEAKIFTRTRVLPYVRRRKEEEGEAKQRHRQCEWCKKTFVSEAIRKKHDPRCKEGRMPTRHKCRIRGCTNHYNTAEERVKHEKKCTIQKCRTIGCDFTGRDTQDAKRHKKICTLTIRCTCGKEFRNAEKKAGQWHAKKRKNGTRIYEVRQQLR